MRISDWSSDVCSSDLCQGAGGGYGDVLQRDPALVMQDLAEDLISPVTAREIYQVAFDQQTRVLDREETARQRDAERQARLARGKPYDQFVQQWQTAEPPAHLDRKSVV